MRHPRNITAFSLLTIILILALAGCGGSGSSLTPDQRAVSTAFDGTAFDPAVILGTGFTSGGLTRPPSSWSWTDASLSNLSLDKSLMNIVVTDTTATATGTFTITGNYTVSGATSTGGTWTKTHAFTLTGSGTINFVKVGDAWQISDIPGILIRSDATKAPSITSFSLSSLTPLRSSPLTVGAQIDTNNGSQFKKFLYFIRGFGSTSPYYSTSTASPVNLSHAIAVAGTAALGINYGGVAVFELTEVTPDSDYDLYFSLYLASVDVTPE